VKAATDLVELIGAFFPLRRAGSSYWALCPFHEEKSPSFHVLADRQIFKCFGCGEAGDAITFVEKREGLSFREALEWLAARAGVTLSERSSGNTLRNRDGVLGCLEEATRHFERLLAGPGTGAADARRYLDERGLPETLRREWRIGLAPAGRQALSGALASRGCTPDALASAGLVGRSDDGRTYDRFRDRITFPIRDVLGRVVGFGARLLPGREEGREHGPKYLNSPDGELFSKRSLLYGLDLARKNLASGTVVLMEGYTDVILAHAAGMKNAVATLGTSLGIEHARVLRRHAERVLLVYDGDEAGLKASERGVGVLLEAGLEVRVATLPDGLDPADFVRERGGPAFVRAVGEGEEFFEFLASRIAARARSRGPEAVSRACDEILGLVAKLESVVHRNRLLAPIAERLAVSEGDLRERLAALLKAKESRATLTPARPRPGRAADALPVRDRQAADDLLAGLLADPSLLALVRGASLPTDALPPSHAAVLEAALACADAGVEPDVTAVIDRLGDREDRKLPADLFASKPEDPENAVRKGLAYLEDASRRRDRDRLEQEIKAAERRGDRERASELSRQLHALDQALKVPKKSGFAGAR